MAYSTALSQAVSILLYIHGISEEPCAKFLSTKVISEQLNIPAPTTVKVIRNLSNAKLTVTKEGAKGGIMLAKPLAEITLLDVFLAVEPGKPLFKLHTDVAVQGKDAEVAAIQQKLSSRLQAAEQALRQSLGEVRLIDLVE
ncbi:Rrf2 family transcriptional regulator [Paenibacillus macerans]|uniref:RrF2 family transcriptional regulator n=1 Tax=Paenibacillus macerans TaxID=44252 RepID=UPI00203CF640|nr:Rrf2 family transcriptional regulator [Paenibacillus macerans]MCM3697795.1 Rrf2 family transcriptional regulator [Paenibacillus macerans]